MLRDVMINVRIPHDLKAGLQRAAEDDHGRSMSGMVVRILSEWLSQHGYFEPKAAAPRGKKRS
jgi:hypothetical protein